MVIARQALEATRRHRFLVWRLLLVKLGGARLAYSPLCWRRCCLSVRPCYLHGHFSLQSRLSWWYKRWWRFSLCTCRNSFAFHNLATISSTAKTGWDSSTNTPVVDLLWPSGWCCRTKRSSSSSRGTPWFAAFAWLAVVASSDQSRLLVDELVSLLLNRTLLNAFASFATVCRAKIHC